MIDQYGNHVMLVWYPIRYFRFEHIRVGPDGKKQGLPDCGDKMPSQMRTTYEWVLQQAGKAQKIIDSTVEEVKITDDSKSGKRTGKRPVGRPRKVHKGP